MDMNIQEKNQKAAREKFFISIRTKISDGGILFCLPYLTGRAAERGGQGGTNFPGPPRFCGPKEFFVGPQSFFG